MTGGGFLKLVSSICASTTFCGFLLTVMSKGFQLPMTGFYLGTLLFFVWNFLNPRDERNTLAWVLYLLVTLTLMTQSYFFQNQDLKIFGFFMGSTLLLGSIVFAMILGHWYLVVPKLSERPLIRLIQFTWLILAIKFFWALVFINNHPEF